MPHHVYANKNEICAKSADGMSVMAVDVCFSPGAPMPGVPVPYMNMCKARDVTNGSKTVFIKGEEICLEDKSYFSTSYGDEPATQAMKKGVISGAVQGKCYFISWSPNVMVEGAAVTRHKDMVTHNHSNPKNTPPVYYLSLASIPADCIKDKKQMDERCKEDDDKGRRKKRKKSKLASKNDKADGWVLDHCGPLLVKPGLDFKDWMNDFGNLDSIVSEATSALQNQVISKLEKEIAEYATKKALKFIARRGLTGWIPIVGWIITAVDVVATGIELAEKIPEMKAQLGELKDLAGRLEEAAKKITGVFDRFKDKIKNFDKLSPKEQEKVARELMVDIQSIYGAANPCMRARKCFLVPYKKTQNEVATWGGDACCPGQTGHHLLPDAMFRDAYAEKGQRRDQNPTMKCWEGYTEGDAPTICLEGDGNSGSHGAVQKATAVLIEPFRSGKTMKYTTARDMVAKEISALYGCNADCLAAQLDKYYADAYKCGSLKGADVTAHTGRPYGGPPDSYGKPKKGDG